MGLSTMNYQRIEGAGIRASQKLSEIDPEIAWRAWQPSLESPWHAERARLLFRRGGFGASPEDLEYALKHSPSQVVDRMLGDSAVKKNEEFERESSQIASSVRAGGDAERLASWWLHRMIHSPSPLVEKMTLFWHEHFATGAEKVTDSELMYTQNQLFRKHALGDFRELVHDISKDAAMLIYLDSESNRKAHPNENYARELMELFCLGEGNYTERDVQELARCFTGWEVRRKMFRFNPYQHDSGRKSLLGTEDIESGEAAIDVVLKHAEMPFFVVGKLFRYLVCDEPYPSKSLLQPLVDRFVESGYKTESVVRQILESELMLSLWPVGKKVRSPVEFAVNLIRSLDATTNLDRLAKALKPLGQALFFPPNVKGWDGGRAWINSSTLIGRSNFVVDLLGDGNTRFQGGPLDEWVKSQRISSLDGWMEWLSNSLLAIPLKPEEQLRWKEQISSSNNTNLWRAALITLSRNAKLQLS